MVLTEPCAKKNSEIPVVSFLPHAISNLPEKTQSLKKEETEAHRG